MFLGKKLNQSGFKFGNKLNNTGFKFGSKFNEIKKIHHLTTSDDKKPSSGLEKGHMKDLQETHQRKF